MDVPARAEAKSKMLRILLVEDSESMRAFVSACLDQGATQLGEVELIQAASGFDALRLLPRGRYDLVISDINMPDINGLELLNFIRANEKYRDLPVLLISTQSSEKDRQRGLALGATVFLAKPFSSEQLVAALRAALDGAS